MLNKIVPKKLHGFSSDKIKGIEKPAGKRLLFPVSQFLHFPACACYFKYKIEVHTDKYDQM